MKNIKLWSIIVGLGVIISAVVGIFTLDDRYAKGEELKILEQKSAQSLDEFNKNQAAQFKAFKVTIDAQHLLLKKQYLDDKVLGLKQLLTQQPNNQVIQIEYDAKIKEQQEVAKQLQQTFK